MGAEVKRQEVELHDSATINWWYPDIYEGKHHLTIELIHTRAADPIRIHYESERDGWVIEQASTFSWEVDAGECDMDWQEVAFIQAWAREKE